MKARFFTSMKTSGKVTGLLLSAAMAIAPFQMTMAEEYTADNPLKIALVIHGTLGDKSFFDSAASGIEKIEAELPVEASIIELSYDRSKWEPGIMDVADSDYDIVIAGTFDMMGYLVELSEEYPEKKFISFDDAPDFSTCSCENLLAIIYGTSTAGYLAGYASGKITETGILGTIIGMEFPGVTDFKTGFDQGALDANPDVKIVNAVAGTFNDPAKGKEIGIAQLNQGADIIFPISGSTGIGALQAVKDADALAVGVDSDQATIFSETDMAQAEVIFTSVEKKVGESLYLAIKGTLDGSQEYGQRILLGLKEGAVGISKNQWYEEIVPADLRAEIEEIEAKIISGEIIVKTDLE